MDMNESTYVVIVNYNGYDDTVECLNSLRNVATPKMFVVVIDNGSTDASPEKLRKYMTYDNEHLICLNENLGFSGGNNAGIRYALNKGASYILLLNNDTVVEPDFLNYMLKKVDTNSVVFGKIMFFDKPSKIWFAGGSYNRWTGKTVHFGYGNETAEYNNIVQNYSFVTGCLLLIPVSVIKKIGMLPEHYFLYYEDTEYSLRLLENGVKIRYADEAVIYHKVSASAQKEPDRTLYYSIRNSLLVISEHEHGIKKIVAFLCVTGRNIKRILSRKYSLNIVMIAYHDFVKGNFGKWKM